MKAFLSHSSQDKEYVRAVFSELGRQYCIFDDQSFETGEELTASINKGLDESSVFVLFASRTALKSTWVNWEMEEAAYRKIQQQIHKAIVFLLEGDITADDIPKWLKRAKFEQAGSPVITATKIRYHIDDIYISNKNRFYFGRKSVEEEAQKILMPYDGSQPPKVIGFFGLSGIGRKTLSAKISSNILGLRNQFVFQIESGDYIKDIAVKLADKIEVFSTQDGLKFIFEEIKKESDSSTISRIKEYLRTLNIKGIMPIFIDQNGILDYSGAISEPIRIILSNLSPADDIYLFLITNRFPHQPREEWVSIPFVRVDPLKSEEIKMLITAKANDEQIKLTGSNIAELAEYIGGYPPAVYYTIKLAKQYGIDLILADKRKLIEFKAISFIRFLKGISLNEYEKLVLRILVSYSPLPIQVIGSILGKEMKVVAETIEKLIDLALLVPDDYSNYSLSDPVIEAVNREFGRATKEESVKVADELNKYLLQIDESNENVPRLAILRAFYQSLIFAGKEADTGNMLFLVSDWVRIAKELYHLREYKQSINYAKQALELRPDNTDARIFLARDYVQEEMWAEAHIEIDYLNKCGNHDEAYFLKGFLERKKEETDEAIQSYLKALEFGKNGAAIHRELALCYFIKKDMENAQKHISLIKRGSENKFVVGLQIQIAIMRRDEETAREKLTILQSIDGTAFYKYRKSTVDFCFKNYDDAYIAAKEAFSAGDKPPFEMYVQIIKCEIQLGKFGDAEKSLEALDKNFSRKKKDIRLRLGCNLEIKRKRYKAALMILNYFENKNKPIYKYLKADALEGLINNNILPDVERIGYLKELEELKREISQYADIDIDIDLLEF